MHTVYFIMHRGPQNSASELVELHVSVVSLYNMNPVVLVLAVTVSINEVLSLF